MRAPACSIYMLPALLDFTRRDVVFICSSVVDEVWIRSTALQCHADGLRVEVIVCGDRGQCPEHAAAAYRAVGIRVRDGISLRAAARVKCRIAVTASSGLDRRIFPTKAHRFVHMPHSLASLHMIYPPAAFDGYDVLFAAGPHHVREFEAIARSRRLDGRRVEAVGYGKLDVLASQLSEHVSRARQRSRVLLAPSWGPDNLLDRCGPALVRALQAAEFEVIVRPHPLFFLEHAPVLDDIRLLAEHEDSIHLESPFAGDDAIFDADVLVGDYSGIGFEFAALRGRSVVSVNVGLKVANPDWQSLGIEPVEIAARNQIGEIVAPEMDEIVAAVRRAVQTADASNARSIATSGFLYGRPGDCAANASARIRELLDSDNS